MSALGEQGATALIHKIILLSPGRSYSCIRHIQPSVRRSFLKDISSEDILSTAKDSGIFKEVNDCTETIDHNPDPLPKLQFYLKSATNVGKSAIKIDDNISGVDELSTWSRGSSAYFKVDGYLLSTDPDFVFGVLAGSVIYYIPIQSSHTLPTHIKHREYATATLRFALNGNRQLVCILTELNPKDESSQPSSPIEKVDLNRAVHRGVDIKRIDDKLVKDQDYLEDDDVDEGVFEDVDLHDLCPFISSNSLIITV
jgi:hypothetical protein